ncbi:oryzain beta chain-like [Carya illinoinensis]|uniref:oryzain beta chain-like n=1 Tax=Carya illinoinensis TaxID=32201 RepID=UPI001C71AC31|nr:oryzain beta chain-like [Carya illinoinensis]
MATPFPGLQHRDGGGGVAVMAGTVNPIETSPSQACVENNPDLKPPILIFLFFHKAIRSDLEGLHRAAMAFATGGGDIKPLLVRYHFLRAIYKHHCNAEDEHNAAEKNWTYKLGLNQFVDLTNEEYRATYLGTKSVSERRLSGPRSDRYEPHVGDKLPQSVDWRKDGAIVGVKDQGSCGEFRSF